MDDLRQRLKDFLYYKRETVGDFSQKLGITRVSYYARFKNKTFTLKELIQVKKEYNLSNDELYNIFFKE